MQAYLSWYKYQQITSSHKARTSSHLAYIYSPLLPGVGDWTQGLRHAKQKLRHWTIAPSLEYLSCAKLKVICWSEWLQHLVPMWSWALPLHVKGKHPSVLLLIRQMTPFIAWVFNSETLLLHGTLQGILIHKQVRAKVCSCELILSVFITFTVKGENSQCTCVYESWPAQIRTIYLSDYPGTSKLSHHWIPQLRAHNRPRSEEFVVMVWMTLVKHQYSALYASILFL